MLPPPVEKPVTPIAPPAPPFVATQHTGNRTCLSSGSDSSTVPEPSGLAVHARALVPPPECVTLARRVHSHPAPDSDEQLTKDGEDGVYEFASDAAFRQRFLCAPPASVDFDRERIALFWVDGSESIRWDFDSAVQTDGGITVITSFSTSCPSNAPETEARRVVMFAAPKDGLLRTLTCMEPIPDC